MAEKAQVLSADEIAALQHAFIGPTWQRNEDGTWYLPERTLGWQIAVWCTRYLRNDEGGPWRFTDEQLRFVLWWYAVDERGEFLYRNGVLQRLKGWGKDPLLAVLCFVEFVGPSRPARDEFGELIYNSKTGHPLAVPHPQAWVQIAAVSKDQTVNTVALFPSLMSDQLRADYSIEPGAELWRANGGKCRMQSVTSNYRTLEGARSTFVLLNETHHWVEGNDGHMMFDTIDGNTTKKKSRYLAITNAYLPGEDSVAQRMRETYDRQMLGEERRTKFLYDSVEAHPDTPLTPEALFIVIPIIRGDAVWLDPEYIIDSVSTSNISPARSRRMWLNQIVTMDDSLYSPGQWDALGQGYDLDLMALKPGDRIALGFDGGKTDDGTALVCIRFSDRRAFLLGYWQRPPELDKELDWEVPREAVDSKVRETFRVYEVSAFYADVALWESFILAWEKDYGPELGVEAASAHAIGWDMRSEKKATLAHEKLVQTILDGQLKHSKDKLMRRHVLNVFRRENNHGVHFGKIARRSSRKIDIYAALLLAFTAMSDYDAKGKTKRKRTGRGYMF